MFTLCYPPSKNANSITVLIIKVTHKDGKKKKKEEYLDETNI